MTFKTQMIIDAQKIIHKGEVNESITYTPDGGSPVSIECIPGDGVPIYLDDLENGDGTVESFPIRITDNSDSDDYPGVAVPARGDAVTFRSKSCIVDAVESKPLNGVWHLMIKVVVEEIRTPTNISANRGR